ncbi:MAG: SUF system NifU family Fe-S cluster assembly protein [Actinomycetota bacterium]|nr:MAG: SUF system NifU family Fe-S cluster assembly protein [Actinomycetota bacterium]
MQLEQLYQEIILDHYKHPHGRGLREPFDAQVHHVNPTCGDEITLRVSLSGDAEPVVTDVSYEGAGCSISQASASVLYDQLVGMTLPEAERVQQEFLALMHSRGDGEPDDEVLGDAVAFHGVSRYPARVKCALLSWMAWQDAVTVALDAAGAARSVGSTTP